jgi:NitT/TauT family transport system substrate-binding protein
MIDFTKMLAATTLLLGFGGGALAQDKVTYGTNWVAEAEHGGFYQALVDGTYAKYGLDVTIKQGGPQVAGQSLLMAGQLDSYMGGSASAINGLAEGVPMVAIAAMFQKDPQVILAHPGEGFEDFANLAKASKALISPVGTTSFWAWMKSAYPGFSDDQLATYTFSLAPFLADPKAIQQGLLTSEPMSIEKEGGFTPKVFLLADYGYRPYSSTITVMKPWLDAHRDVAKRFVEASIIGWYHYLYGDNAAANAMIKAENPEMTDELIGYAIAQMKAGGMLVSSDAAAGGIGCMTDARWAEYYALGTSIGMFPAGLDVTQAYDSEFVCKGLGVELVK